MGTSFPRFSSHRTLLSLSVVALMATAWLIASGILASAQMPDPTVPAAVPVGFACEADGGVLSWTDAEQAKYWTYRKAPGTDNFVWLGKTLGATTITDPSRVSGTEYQVHYQGIARADCTIVSEPAVPGPGPFACEADGGVLSWSDAGQAKYWIYKTAPERATSVWVGRTLGATTITDPNPAEGTRYQVHHPGLARVDCTIAVDPVDPVDPVGSPLPGIIEAEDYDTEGFFDVSVGNAGGAYRDDDVDVFQTRTSVGGYVDGEFAVGSTRDSEWLEYTVAVEEDSRYTVDIRWASGHDGTGDPTVPDGPGGVVLSVDGVMAASVSLERSYGWWSFTTDRVGAVDMSAGSRVIRVEIIDGYFTFDQLSFRRVATSAEFECQVQFGNVSWPEAARDSYQVLKQAPAEADFTALGQTDETSFRDPNPEAGSRYQVAYEGLAPVDCNVFREPGSCPDCDILAEARQLQTPPCEWQSVTCSGSNPTLITAYTTRQWTPVLGRLKNLETLKISWNYSYYEEPIETIGREIGELTNLRTLHLNNSKMSSLPPEIGNLTNLVEFELRDTRVTELPSEFWNLTNLEHLDLTSTLLPSLPPELWTLTKLQALTLTPGYVGREWAWTVDELPPEIGNLTDLVELTLRNTQLAELPPAFGNLTALELLDLSSDLSRGQLASLPAEFGNLANLQVLRLDGNRIGALPAEFTNLVNLQVLRLDDNRLEVLPPEIGNLTSLTELDVAQNRLFSLPAELANLTQLETLNFRDRLAGNCIESVAPALNELVVSLGFDGDYCGAKCPQFDFDQDDCRTLARIHPKMVESPSFRDATKPSCSVTEGSSPSYSGGTLSAGCTGQRVTGFYFSENRDIYGWRTYGADAMIEITKLTEIRSIRTFYSTITLPPEIGNLVNLEYLDLRGTGVSSLPPEIGNLTKLVELYGPGMVSMDRVEARSSMTSVPQEIGNLISLEVLHLPAARLTELPPEIGNLAKLRVLRLDHNELSTLPAEIGDLGELRALRVNANPLVSLPAEIANLNNLVLFTGGSCGTITDQAVRDWLTARDLGLGC